MPFIVVLLMARPFFLIRLGRCDIGRIGGMYLADFYLAERNAGRHKGKVFDIFFLVRSTGSVSNQQWLKMWERSLRVFKLWQIAEVVYQFVKKVPFLRVHIIPVRNFLYPAYGIKYEGASTQKYVQAYTKSPLSFNDEEVAFGQRALLTLGIPDGKPFICFHSRDDGYLSKICPGYDWKYHDYRDSKISHYVPAAEALTRRGYAAVRMGAFVREKVNSGNPLIIDYATNGQRTDFLDIYLGAKCRFFIGSDTGITIVPEVFRRPMVYVNWTPLLRVPSFYVHKALIIPKKMFYSDGRRPVTFREIVNSPMGSLGSGEVLERQGIELVENDPREIADAAFEMEERLQGTWQGTAEDEFLQARFWKLFEPYQLDNSGVRIGAAFLRNNKHLLD